MSSRPVGGAWKRGPIATFLSKGKGESVIRSIRPKAQGFPNKKGRRLKSGRPFLNSLAAAGYFDSSTCSKSSSTGVARPKIDTDTLTRFFSKSSSSTTPLKLAKGPSSTLTLSPIS